MSESLISRINRLITGTVHDSVDNMEAAVPATAMRQAIRELDGTIDDVREQLGEARREQQVAARRIALTQGKIEKLFEKVQTALSAKREDLAEAAVNRQLDLEAQIPVLEKSRDVANERGLELNGYITALNGRKAEMEAELDAFQQMQKELSDVATDGDLAGESCAHAKRADKAQNAFDRVMKSSTGVTGIQTSDRDTMAKLVELEAVQRKEQIAERMKAYKSATSTAEENVA